ncbi:MAG: OadG family protein [Clostridia bacterium]|nr:OadG family protein [Clostridia bacterium]
MINALSEIIPKLDGNFYFSNKAEALIYALIGFCVVLLGIVIIIFIIWLLGLILRKTDNLAFLTKRRKKPKKQVEEVSSETVAEDGLTDEVKAAIIAAIMAYYSEEKPECEFKVRRIKRL